MAGIVFGEEGPTAEARTDDGQSLKDFRAVAWPIVIERAAKAALTNKGHLAVMRNGGSLHA